MKASAQWVRLYSLGEPYCAEVVHARYVEHRFARHAHDHYVIGIVERGVQQYTYRGATHATPAGQTFLVNGGEPHTGEPAVDAGYIYRTLCLEREPLRQLALDIGQRSELPYLSGAVVADPLLFARLLRLHRAIAANAPAMHRESFLMAAVARVFEAHTEHRLRPLEAERHSSGVQRAIDYMEAHYSEDISLAQLAALSSRSPFHLARTFSQQVGLPPHAYLESVRIRRARELLQSGISIADTALRVGYPDQSHFTHRFRRHTGLTPGLYRTRKITQDRRRLGR